jgi:hypothetical protein
MLFKQNFFAGLADGTITLAFRRWKRPSVKAGTELRSPVGILHIDAVELSDPSLITAEDAERAGYENVQELLVELNNYQGKLYRVEFHYAGADPRIALRQSGELSDEDFAKIRERLQRYESRMAWTTPTLRMIQADPGRRAGDLAPRLPMRTRTFKRRVRQLKDLGLTESLGTGYRISPRGAAYLERLDQLDGSSK